MKSLRLLFQTWLFCGLALLCGCTSMTAYDYMDNWVIRENAIPRYFADYDVFFVYPSMFVSDVDIYPNWSKDRNYAEVVYNYTLFHTKEGLGRKVRVFSPFIHQLERSHYDMLMAWEGVENYPESNVGRAIKETTDALRYYLENYHDEGRPFILIGQGQGALILYEALKECEEITPELGFVAAYLYGIPPFWTKWDILQDFGTRGIRAAQGELDLGVIAMWRVQLDDGLPVNPHVKYGYVINPLNWKSDSDFVSSEHNLGSSVYNPDAEKIAQRRVSVPGMVSAQIDTQTASLKVKIDDAFIDPKTGKLRVKVGVKPIEQKDQKTVILKDVFLTEEGASHPFNIQGYGYFSGNIFDNARKRVAQYNYLRQWK